jgi:uncharacterized membrane protein
MTIEEAFKMIISGGILSPDILKTTGTVEQTANRQQ